MQESVHTKGKNMRFKRLLKRHKCDFLVQGLSHFEQVVRSLQALVKQRSETHQARGHHMHTARIHTIHFIRSTHTFRL